MGRTSTGSKSPHRPADEPVQVVLIEDDPDDVRRIRAGFDEMEFEYAIDVYTTGDEALDALLESHPRSYPDFVLLDLTLPGTSGGDVLEAIASQTKLRHLPVIVLTDSDATEDIERSYATAANAYVTKPPNGSEYTSIIAAIERFWIKQAQLPPKTA
ncbi:response regulator [Natronolimnobius sp. AArcel1]|uniref:response regulator n=1 Tax=Natronolimnobius sp. AArcel1 TaxID=1679093 RepID=UPI0013EA53F8|nr:response regulator [Natronolimnobius sp. AArcel1]NGM69722.1 response regulator [Natronolimnobius sp. AArcel1]